MVTTKQRIAFNQSPMERRQFLLDPEDCSSRGSHRLAEVAGGTTAECAAVVCCFPCTVVNFLVLAVYKVPAGLCRKALRKKRRRRLMKKGLLMKSGRGVSDISSTHGISIDGTEFSLRPEAAERLVVKSMDADEDLMELENEMWETFYGTGFWRSLSKDRLNDPVSPVLVDHKPKPLSHVMLVRYKSATRTPIERKS